MDAPLKPGLFDLMAENVFGGRGSANVSEADKKNTEGGLGHESSMLFRAVSGFYAIAARGRMALLKWR